MLTQRTTKATMKEVEEISSTSIYNLFHDPRYKKTNEIFNRNKERMWFVDSKALFGLLGKPLINMRGYESYPGVWILECETGIKWIIWSDCHHKNSWKGTSYEVSLPDNFTDDMLAKSFQSLFDQYIFKCTK